MAYPPSTLATTRTDATATATTHKDDHNNANAAINDIVAELGTSPAGNLTDATMNAWMYVGKQAADLTNATTTPSNTDMVFTFVANGVYVVELYLLATSAATTTGYGFALDTSVAVTSVSLTFNHQLANTGTLSGGQSIADNTATGLSSGVPTASALTPIFGGGLLMAAGTGGTATLTFRPEVAASATLKANSVMRVQRVA